MARKKLSPELSKLLADKVMDLGNFAVVALVFGQLVSGGELSAPLLILGLLLLFFCYIVGYRLNK